MSTVPMDAVLRPRSAGSSADCSGRFQAVGTTAFSLPLRSPVLLFGPSAALHSSYLDCATNFGGEGGRLPCSYPRTVHSPKPELQLSPGCLQVRTRQCCNAVTRACCDWRAQSSNQGKCAGATARHVFASIDSSPARVHVAGFRQDTDVWVKEYDEAKQLAQEILQLIQDRNVQNASGGPEASRKTATARRKIGTLGTLIEKLLKSVDAPDTNL